MRKITLSMNMTLDGFFNLDWMGFVRNTPMLTALFLSFLLCFQEIFLKGGYYIT